MEDGACLALAAFRHLRGIFFLIGSEPCLPLLLLPSLLPSSALHFGQKEIFAFLPCLACLAHFFHCPLLPVFVLCLVVVVGGGWFVGWSVVAGGLWPLLASGGAARPAEQCFRNIMEKDHSLWEIPFLPLPPPFPDPFPDSSFVPFQTYEHFLNVFVFIH